MPLPLSHSLAGASLYAGFDREPGAGSYLRLGVAMVLANAPDFDLIPGILLGDPNRYHHGATHSLFTAVAIGVVAALVVRLTGTAWPVRGSLPAPAATGMMVGALWASHVILDAFTLDTSPPVGVPMFWPLADARVSWWPIFDRADKVSGLATPLGFLASLVSWHNLRAIAREAALLAPLLVFVVWSRRRR